jgi:HEAT repeat protein
LQGDISPRVRDKAAWAIGKIGPAAKDAVPTLLDALKKKHPLQDYHGRGVDGLDETIYKTCIKSLGEIGTDQACAALAAMLTDQSKASLQGDALKALAKMALIKIFKNIGPAAASCLPQLNECMQSKDAVLRRVALDAILAIEGNEKNKQTLLSQALNDSDEEIKQNAASALASANGASRESVKSLMVNAETGKPEVRITSIKTLGDYGPLAEEALPMLIKSNLGSAFVPQQRKAAFDAIKRIDPSGKVRAAIELLEFIGSPQCNSLAKSLRAQWHM